jgi:acyl carrier protein
MALRSAPNRNLGYSTSNDQTWGGAADINKLRALIPGCLEVDLGRVTDNAQLSRDLGADRLDRLELMTLVEEITGVEITDDELNQIEVI